MIADTMQIRYNCKKCNNSYAYKNGLTLHIKSKHSESPTAHACFDCAKIFKNQYCLKQHIKYMHSIMPKKSYECKECKRSFVNKHGLDYHNTSKHGLGYYGFRYCCKVCNKLFTTMHSLNRHSQKIHKINTNFKKEISDPNDKNRFKCEKCNNSYVYKAGLALHIKSKHSESPNYVCKICNKVYSYNVSLTNHVNFVHK